MKCSKCGKENRQEAKYCRFCGEVIAQEPSLEGLIGKDSILPVLESLDARLKVASGRANSGARFGMDCLVLGDSGTGKNFIARLIAGKMLSSGVIKTPPKVVDAAEWAEFAGNFDENIGQLRDGVLIITNAQKLVPTTRATDVILLDKLFMRMRTTEGAPVLILCGMLNEMSDFLEHNPDVHRLFEFDFKLESFGVQELTQLTKSLLEDKFGLKADDDLPARLKAHFTWYMRQPDLGHNNGHLAERVAEDLSVRAALRGSKTVSACDVDPKECFIPKSEEDILAELDSYIGLQSVKDQIRAIVKSVKDKKEKGVAANKLITDHFIFTGNPGTGKTTFARKLGEVLASIGALPTGQFEEIEAKSLLGQWIGHTEENVRKAVAKAMGGVLFIDEAYALSQSTVGVSGGSFGMDAINTLLPILENKLADGSIPGGSLISGLLTPERAVSMLNMLPQSTKDSILVQYVKQNQDQIARQLEQFASSEGVKLQVDQVSAKTE